MGWILKGNKFYFYRSTIVQGKVVTRYIGQHPNVIDVWNWTDPKDYFLKKALRYERIAGKELVSRDYLEKVNNTLKTITDLVYCVFMITNHHLDYKGVWRKAHTSTLHKGVCDKAIVRSLLKKAPSLNGQYINLDHYFYEFLGSIQANLVETYGELEALASELLTEAQEKIASIADNPNFVYFGLCNPFETNKEVDRPNTYWDFDNEDSLPNDLELLLMTAQNLALLNSKLVWFEITKLNQEILLTEHPRPYLPNLKFLRLMLQRFKNHYLRAERNIVRINKLAKKCPELKADIWHISCYNQNNASPLDKTNTSETEEILNCLESGKNLIFF